MGKTIRRKDYEDQQGCSWSRAGRKTAGYYTMSEYLGDGVYSYRAPTEKEKNKQYWKDHGESKTSNSHSPGKSYRKPRTRQWRQKARQELHKFWANPEYEVMLDENPIDCWWDWS